MAWYRGLAIQYSWRLRRLLGLIDSLTHPCLLTVTEGAEEMLDLEGFLNQGHGKHSVDRGFRDEMQSKIIIHVNAVGILTTCIVLHVNLASVSETSPASPPHHDATSNDRYSAHLSPC